MIPFTREQLYLVTGIIVLYICTGFFAGYMVGIITYKPHQLSWSERVYIRTASKLVQRRMLKNERKNNNGTL